MENQFNYKIDRTTVALDLEDYYVWDCSVIKADGKYHMFASRWREELGFDWNWLFNSEIIQCVSDKPQGPYKFLRVVLKRRGREFFDGMNTHNPCIKFFNGKYYLYYMGTTYGGNILTKKDEVSQEYGLETWNRKRIGVAVADGIYDDFVRRDEPLLQPRDCSKWDCTITSNPSVAILPNGTTYMIYKSRSSVGSPLKLGVAISPSPDGKFERLTDMPILQFDDENKHLEDPFLWYDVERKKFCIVIKDDSKNGSHGVTGEFGAGFYAESDDCINFKIPDEPKVYSRKLKWEDGSESTQCNLERPNILFDEQNKPLYLFCATGNGCEPYSFTGRTYVVASHLTKKI